MRKNYSRMLAIAAGILCFVAAVLREAWVFYPIGCVMLIYAITPVKEK